jgi:LAO/AO transport system kinase
MSQASMLEKLRSGDIRAMARAISLVENEGSGYEELLEAAGTAQRRPIIGITGPPGAGKSTLVDGLIGTLAEKGKRTAVLCVDPSSPFHMGALLGDRIRLSRWYSHPDVFIRSLASRGSMGGLHPSILEIASLLSVCPFDYILIETVGVGQSEVEIAGLADVTVVVLVPEAGDDIQAMKSGLMEVADVFVVNKSDRPDADLFLHNLRLMMGPAYQQGRKEIPVVKTVASTYQGLDTLWMEIEQQLGHTMSADRQIELLTERAWHLIQKRRMRGLTRADLRASIRDALNIGAFNLYSFVKQF